MLKKLALATLIIGLVIKAQAQQKLRVVVAGLNHDHIYNILNAYSKGTVEIAAIAEPSKPLQEKFARRFHLPQNLFYQDLKKAVLAAKPDAVLGYCEVAGHLGIVQICAPLGIPVMVEKPLAATLQQAQQIRALAIQYHVPVLTNYETTWYSSYQDVYNTIGQDSIGSIKKMVFHDGHQGPREIGCSPEFLSWLTDPVLNGAGALNDFGCYGADLMTWLMKGEKPVAVTAVTRHYKPEVYPKVEDDATVIVEYKNATGLIEASWNWPFSIKDMEVFGQKGYLHAFNQTDIGSRTHENLKAERKAQPLPIQISDPLIYLAAVLKNKTRLPDDQSSLKYNMLVMQILDAAKRSAKEGRRIAL